MKPVSTKSQARLLAKRNKLSTQQDRVNTHLNGFIDGLGYYQTLLNKELKNFKSQRIKMLKRQLAEIKDLDKKLKLYWKEVAKQNRIESKQ